MKSLKNLSLFKVIIVTLISLYFNKAIIYLFSIIYLFLDNRISILFFVLLLFITSFISRIECDFIDVGIIEDKKNSYYLVDKVLYKTKLITKDELQIGDLLKFNNDFKTNEYESEVIKNIKYYGSNYEYLYSIQIKRDIFNTVNNADCNIKSALLKFIYNINTYEDLSFNFGYGLAIYYFLKSIYKRNKYISITLLVIYSLIFTFNIKFFLLIIDFLLSFIKLEKLDKFSIKLYLIYLINNKLFLNYSFLITLLINLYELFDIKYNFKTYISIIQSVLFGEINITNSLFFKYVVKIQISLFIFSILVLLIPELTNIYSLILSIYSKFNDINLNIRGSLSIIGFLILSICKTHFIKNDNLVYVLLLLILISPINRPFSHVSFIDVGQGDSILIKNLLNSGNVLIDTGSKYNYYKLKSYLFKQGIYKIDYLIISHDDEDHNGNVESLQNDFTIDNIITSGRNINFNNVQFNYYYLDEFDNDNDNSLVYGFKFNDLRYLLTGDISSKAEKIFINQYGNNRFDVLKVSHHGSKTATSKYFLENILPKFAVISTSGQYNHPNKEVIDNLNAYKVSTYVTKVDKNIEFYNIFNLNILKYGNTNFVIIK